MINNFCLAALELMRGNSMPSLEGMKDNTNYPYIKEALMAFNHACQLRDELTLKDSTNTEKRREEKRRSLIKVVKHLEKVFNGALHLSWECDADRGTKSKSRTAYDSKDNGYSRDAFKIIKDPKNLELIALATVCYLLRAHSLFFCRVDNQRTFNAAKVALNDLHQAYQLAWRLYHALPQNHHEDPSRSLQSYLNEVITPSSAGLKGWILPSFVWNVLLLCDIFRGNIYRKIGFQERADNNYRHAENRFELIAKHLKNKNLAISSEFASPTVVCALFERSKVLFDLGHLLESLQRQVRCLELLVSQSTGVKKKKTKLIARLSKIWGYLEAERCLPMYDRAGITSCFGLTKSKLSLPRHLIGNIMASHASLVAAILARVGFTIYTLAPHGMKPIDSKTENWLLEYYQFDKEWNAKTNKKIRGSRLGVYGKTLLSVSRHSNSPDKSIFADQIERRFALLLRRMKLSGKSAIKNLDEVTFYRNILGSTTQNIGNIVTIPRQNHRLLMRHGYVHRRTYGDLGRKTVYDGLCASLGLDGASLPTPTPVNKLVVLRRWQSFNPKIPRPSGVSVRGGGYFLLWQGKGIVIDPGYNFIQTFYDEGFSLEDIDAIVITHSHPDHDDDFATLTTLMREWNEFHERTGESQLCKSWDFFLNESTHKKFSSWLQASDVKFGRIIPLPSLWWDKDTARADMGPFRGNTVLLDLQPPDQGNDQNNLISTRRKIGKDSQNDTAHYHRKPYHMAFEVVPAWHDDVIGRTAAVGLKIHLYEPGSKKPVGVIGYTGDTGAYGLHIAKPDDSPQELCIDKYYCDCDVLIAHLGDIRLRELASVMAEKKSPWLVSGSRSLPNAHPLLQLLRSWFEDIMAGNPPVNVDVYDKVCQFLDFAITLELIPLWALRMKVPLQGQDEQFEEIQRWLGAFVRERKKNTMCVSEVWTLNEKGLAAIEEHARDIGKPLISNTLKKIKKELNNSTKITATINGQQHVKDAYKLLEFLCVASLTTWQYQYHLGIFGLYRLFNTMAKYKKNGSIARTMISRVFVVGELPEELTSYRHAVACWLNRIDANKCVGDSQIRPVYAFTGDIGLHIGLHIENKDNIAYLEPRIRCAFCNQNNETACARANYHPPQKMREFAIKRQQASMIYLCTTKDHSPEGDDVPLDFLSRPERS